MKIIFDLERCVEDGICAQMCPEGVIEMVDEKPQIVNLDKCTGCKACEVSCEYNALKVEE